MVLRLVYFRTVHGNVVALIVAYLQRDLSFSMMMAYLVSIMMTVYLTLRKQAVIILVAAYLQDMRADLFSYTYLLAAGWS